MDIIDIETHKLTHIITQMYIQTYLWEERSQKKINQIMVETHLNSLFSGLDTVQPTACETTSVYESVCEQRKGEP